MKTLSKKKFWRLYKELNSCEGLNLGKQEIVDLALSLLEFEPDQRDSQITHEHMDFYAARPIRLETNRLASNFCNQLDDYSEISNGDYSIQSYAKAQKIICSANNIGW